MVYKKYVYKGGQRFGPYYYESYRDGNTVKKRYIGTSLPVEPEKLIQQKEKPHVPNVIYAFMIIFVLASAAFLFINYNDEIKSITGYSISEKTSEIFEKNIEQSVEQPLENDISDKEDIVQEINPEILEQINDNYDEKEKIFEELNEEEIKDDYINTLDDKTVFFSGLAAPLNTTNGAFFEGWESNSLLTNNWTATQVLGTWNTTDSNMYAGSYAVFSEPANFQANLSNNISTIGYENITLGFYWRTQAFDPGDIYGLYYFNGTDWKTINSSLGIQETGYVVFNYSFPSDASNNPNFRIRFLCNPNNNNERCYADNILVTGRDIININLTDFYAMNDSQGRINNFSTKYLEDIDYMVLNFSVSTIGTIQSWQLNFTANGSGACALGNKQNDICYNYTNTQYKWIRFINNTNTNTYNSLSQGFEDNIIQSVNFSDNQLKINFILDEHYRPNLFKFYNAGFNFSDSKWQNGINQRITSSTYLKIEFNKTNIPLNADQYKIELRVNYSGNPKEPLAIYLCNSSYVPGDTVFSLKCVFVSRVYPNELKDDGTKYIGIFTKNLVNSLGDIKYALLISGEVNTSNYYYIKTYKTTAPSYTTKWEYTNNYGINWNNLNDGYETDFGLFWYYDGLEPSSFVYRFWINTTRGINKFFEGNITWSINPNYNYKPLVTIISPFSTQEITLPTKINFSTADPNNDNLNVSLLLYHQNGTLDHIIIFGMNQTNLSYHWAENIADGNYSLLLKACELSTSELYCVNDSSEIFISNTYPAIVIHSPLNITYNTQNILINFSSDDVNLNTLWYYNETGNTTFTSPYYLTLPYGSHTFIFYANDTVGSTNSTSLSFSIVSDTTPPSINLISPPDSAIDVNGNLTLNCSVSDNIGLKNITLYFDNLKNQTINLNFNKSVNASFILNNIPYGIYEWTCLAYDGSGNKNWGANRSVFVDVSAAPIYNTSYFTGNTTNWLEVEDITNVCNGNAILENVNTGLIQWRGCVNAQNADFNKYIIIGNNNITVISQNLSNTFNSSARLKMKNLSWDATPLIYKDGILCQSPRCTSVIYNASSGIAEFNVTGFTSYTTGGNSQLTIWDENDTGMPYGDQTKYANDTVKFFADYTKKTDNAKITDANCTIYFNDSISGNMTYNSTIQYQVFNRTFINGNFKWNVTCTKQGFQTLNTNDTITILPDTIGPKFSNIVPGTGSVQLVNTSITISLTIIDGSGVNLALVNITLPNGTLEQRTLNKSGDSYFRVFYLYANLTGRYNLTFFATDALGNPNYTTSYFNADYTLPPTPTTGGKSSRPSAEFIFYPSLMKISLKKGEIKQEQLIIKNTGATTTTIELSSEFANGFVSFSESSFTLSGGSEKSINVFVEETPGLIPGVYEGTIIATSKGISKELPVIITFEEDYALDVDVNIPKKSLTLGEEIVSEITLFKTNMIEEYVQMYYTIKTLKNETLLSMGEKIKLYDQAKLTRAFNMPLGSDTDTYILHVSAVTKDLSVSDADLFSVIDIEMPAKDQTGFILGFVVIVVIFGIALFVVITIRKIKEKDFFSRV